MNDIAPDLRFGSGLDNQRAVTVKSTFLQNRSYLDFYYREAFTVVEMEAGPFCNALYEIADADRHPVNEAVNFSKLPVDFGIIHYASDTPYTQASNPGARGLSYYGMDSTYASSRDPPPRAAARGRARLGTSAAHAEGGCRPARADEARGRAPRDVGARVAVGRPTNARRIRVGLRFSWERWRTPAEEDGVARVQHGRLLLSPDTLCRYPGQVVH